MDRRAFLTWVGIGWVASSLPVAIAACSRTPEVESAQPEAPSANNQPANNQSSGFQTVGTTTELDQKGQILRQGLASGPVLVVRNPTDTTQLVAVNPTCPHRNCLVTWEAAQQELVCPCHNSKFGLDGQVLTGPAKTPLKTFATKIEGQSVLVQES